MKPSVYFGHFRNKNQISKNTPILFLKSQGKMR